MSALREKWIRKTREELIEEYCNKTGKKSSLFQNQTDKWVKNVLEKENIEFYKRVYFSLDRTYKIEIQQDGEITSTFEVVGNTVEKAIRAKTGYSLTLKEIKVREDADMIVTLIDSELSVYKQTPRVSYYEIVATHIYRGSRYEEVDWETGSRVLRPKVRRNRDGKQI